MIIIIIIIIYYYYVKVINMVSFNCTIYVKTLQWNLTLCRKFYILRKKKYIVKLI